MKNLKDLNKITIEEAQTLANNNFYFNIKDGKIKGILLK